MACEGSATVLTLQPLLYCCIPYLHALQVVGQFNHHVVDSKTKRRRADTRYVTAVFWDVRNSRIELRRNGMARQGKEREARSYKVNDELMEPAMERSTRSSHSSGAHVAGRPSVQCSGTGHLEGAKSEFQRSHVSRQEPKQQTKKGQATHLHSRAHRPYHPIILPT